MANEKKKHPISLINSSYNNPKFRTHRHLGKFDNSLQYTKGDDVLSKFLKRLYVKKPNTPNTLSENLLDWPFRRDHIQNLEMRSTNTTWKLTLPGLEVIARGTPIAAASAAAPRNPTPKKEANTNANIVAITEVINQRFSGGQEKAYFSPGKIHFDSVITFLVKNLQQHDMFHSKPLDAQLFSIGLPNIMG